MASNKTHLHSSFRLRDDWEPGKSAFQEDDGRYSGQPREPSADIDPLQLRRELKMQSLGRQIVSTLYMLVRNVKIHSPDNKIFLKPIDTLKETMNAVIASDRQLQLHAVDTTIYLNNLQIRFDFGALDSVQFMTKEFAARDIGGFSSSRPVTSQEIRDFLQVFSSEIRSFNERGLEGHELGSMRLARHAKVKEILDKLQATPDIDEKVDRKKYLMVVYARCVVFMRKYLDKISEGDYSIPYAKAGRLVQDLVDLCYESTAHFLGLTTVRSETDYLAFHSANCALLSIVFGIELGLDKRQLHELGMAALFSQIGLVDMPEELLQRKGGLTEEERVLIDRFPLRSGKKILRSRGLNKTTMHRIVATYEAKVDYAIPQKNDDGEVELVLPKLGLGIYGKVIAIVDTYDALTSRRPFREAYGPSIALALMSSELKYKFDPLLLRVFMKVMAIQPIKILSPDQSTLRLS